MSVQWFPEPRWPITYYPRHIAMDSIRPYSSKGSAFRQEEWAILAQALQQHAADHEVTRVEASPYGQRYILEGSILSPDGRNPLIRTVWFMETDEDTPWFVTAYPPRRATYD